MKKILVTIVAAGLGFAGLAHASGGGVHWGYTGEAGPEHWGELAPAFVACKEGKSQSPVDLTGLVDVDLPPIKFKYAPVTLEVVNNGHAIQVNYPAGGQITVDGKTYDLLQFHFHSPSENTIEGRSFPLEAHLVHKDAEGKLAVVAVMFEIGPADPVVAEIWDYMPPKAGTARLVSHLSVDAMQLLPENKEYFAFDGSLTTPPCTEGVKWMVLKQPMTISADQLKMFQMTMHGPNNRPVQPLYERVVFE